MGSLRAQAGQGSRKRRPHGVAPLAVSTRCLWPPADTQTVFLAGAMAGSVLPGPGDDPAGPTAANGQRSVS